VLDAYLQELERSARRELSESEAGALVAEAREHLAESIQSRLELGMSPEEAEREAVAVFGTAHAIGQETRRRESRIDRPFLFSCLAVVAFWGFVGSLRAALPEWATPLFAIAAVGIHAAFIVTSVYARRLQAVTLALVLGPLWLGWATFQAATHVVGPTPYSDDDYRTHREWVPDEIRNDRAWAAQIRRQRRRLARDHARFLRDGGDLSPSRQASFTPAGELRLFRRSDHAKAATLWNAALENARITDEQAARTIEANAAALEAAARAPWWPQIPKEMVYALGESVGPFAVVYDVIHVTAWLTGAFLRRRRSRGGKAFA